MQDMAVADVRHTQSDILRPEDSSTPAAEQDMDIQVADIEHILVQGQGVAAPAAEVGDTSIHTAEDDPAALAAATATEEAPTTAAGTGTTDTSSPTSGGQNDESVPKTLVARIHRFPRPGGWRATRRLDVCQKGTVIVIDRTSPSRCLCNGFADIGEES